MERSLKELLDLYNPAASLEHASTIPAPWYTDPRISELERQAVFARTWQVVGRAEQLREKGSFLTAGVAGEPVVVVRGEDGIVRGFFNVCRHHAAAVVTEPAGRAAQFRCPYHGWTYGTDGALKGVPEFEGVCNFDRAKNGLLPVRAELWENFVFVNLDAQAKPLREFLGGLTLLVEPLRLGELRFFERRTYTLQCNWKVYVDNYLDGGYHVPHLHRGLNSVLEYKQYTVENFEHYCVQSSPVRSDADSDAAAAATRQGRAFYLWLYPNFMINAYAGVMATNLVLPLGIDRCEVIFDFYFADTGVASLAHHRESITVSEKVQEEDVAICEAVQRGLHSRAYGAGRLSVRREAGEHLFHRLLHADLTKGLEQAAHQM
ncbi:MAG TPA: aromatic ring-hydroxylating dioxygenase subunit alpha [Candidatus Acidoferrales bacterium]|nr:aromatic ring-hydroxylating dioxygenase subunit alpha [Candidatus Acidoferrales bacterium]